MKTVRFHSLKVGSVVTIAWLCAACVCMAGPAAGFSGTAVAGSSNGGASAGGHAAAGSSSGGHSVSAMASHPAGISHVGTVGGFAPANNTLRPITATYSGPPHYLPGGFTPTSVSRAPFANAGSGRAATLPYPTAPSVPASRVAPVATAERARNAWTDPSSAQTVGGPRRGNNFFSTTGLANANRDPFSNRNGADHGQSDDRSGRRRGFPFFRRRGYYNGYGYGYPYGVYGGYDPYAYGDVGGITADASGDDNDAAPGVNGAPFGGPGSAAMTTTQPADSGSDAMPPDSASGSPMQAPPARNLQSNTGPDSLVEAVQAELSRRGYFGGEIDAVYNAATHAAIERFQADQQLPATGRINEATLHALQLD